MKIICRYALKNSKILPRRKIRVEGIIFSIEKSVTGSATAVANMLDGALSDRFFGKSRLAGQGVSDLGGRFLRFAFRLALRFGSRETFGCGFTFPHRTHLRFAFPGGAASGKAEHSSAENPAEKQRHQAVDLPFFMIHLGSIPFRLGRALLLISKSNTHEQDKKLHRYGIY